MLQPPAKPPLLPLLLLCLTVGWVQTKASILFGRPVLQTVNVAFASLNVILLSSLLLMSSYNLLLVHLAKLQWCDMSHRCRSHAKRPPIQIAVICTIYIAGTGESAQ